MIHRRCSTGFYIRLCNATYIPELQRYLVVGSNCCVLNILSFSLWLENFRKWKSLNGNENGEDEVLLRKRCLEVL